MAPATHHARERIACLQAALRGAAVEAALFTYSRTLLYYCGTTHPAFLVVTPHAFVLLVLKSLERAAEETFLGGGDISPARGFEDVKETLDRLGVTGGRLGLEPDVMPAKTFLHITRGLPGFDPVDISRMVLDQRKVKDALEIESMREACRILHQGHLRILSVLRPGMTELELSAEIECAHRKAGHEGLYFIRQPDFFMGRGPLASGDNAAILPGRVQSISGAGLSPSIPMGASSRKIRSGDAIVVDIPTHYRGYHCDQTRTYVPGRPTEACKALYDGLREIADRTLAWVRPGVPCAGVCRKAFEAADELGLANPFMRIGTGERSAVVPFIGHGIGIELNEPPLIGPDSNEKLEEGMVFTLEMQMGGRAGHAVKLEDMVLVTREGAEILTVTPRELHAV